MNINYNSQRKMYLQESALTSDKKIISWSVNLKNML